MAISTDNRWGHLNLTDVCNWWPHELGSVRVGVLRWLAAGANCILNRGLGDDQDDGGCVCCVPVPASCLLAEAALGACSFLGLCSPLPGGERGDCRSG